MAEMDTQIPGWLQRNWAPRETFDPTPWLQERYRRQQEAQVMPLKLQQMALQNKASELAVETQGLQNDLANQEMAFYQEDLPVLREAMAAANSVPGGATGMPVPQFRSRQAQAQWLQRQGMDAQLVFNKAFATDQIELTKTAAELTGKGYDVSAAQGEGPNGTPRWDRAKLSEIANLAAEDASIRAIELRKAGLLGRGGAEYAPVIEELTYNGKKVPILVNPHTGRYELLKNTPSPAAKAEISMNAARVKELYKAHDAISDKEPRQLPFTTQRTPNADKRKAILEQIEALKARNRELAGEAIGFGSESEAAPAAVEGELLQFVPGKGIVPATPSEPPPTLP